MANASASAVLFLGITIFAVANIALYFADPVTYLAYGVNITDMIATVVAMIALIGVITAGLSGWGFGVSPSAKFGEVVGGFVILGGLLFRIGPIDLGLTTINIGFGLATNLYNLPADPWGIYHIIVGGLSVVTFIAGLIVLSGGQ